MTSRERALTVILLGVLLLGGLIFAAGVFYFTPNRELNDQIEAANKMIEERKADIRKKQRAIARIEQVHPRLEKWHKLSLPDLKGKSKTAEAYTKHMTRVQLEYQRHLARLLQDSRFRATSLTATKLNVNAGPEIRRGVPFYRTLSFTVEGQANLATVVRLFEDIHKTNLLHQIKDFTLTVPGTSSQGQQKDDLDVRFTVESIMVSGAETREELLPKLEEKENPIVLASLDRRYDNLLDRNPFFEMKEDKKEEDPKEARDVVLRFVRLTGIYRKEDRRRKATLINLGNKDDITRIAVSPAWEAFIVRDRYGEEVLRGKLVYLDGQEAVMEIDGKHYLMGLGESLYHSMRKGALGEDELKAREIEIPKSDEKKTAKTD